MRCKRSLEGTTRAQYTTGELVSRGPIEALNVCRRVVTTIFASRPFTNESKNATRR
jgi:hypothetical protein